MEQDPISHEQEINFFRKMLNSRVGLIILTIVLTGPSVWLLAGATVASKVDTIIDQNALKHYEDSVQNAYLVNQNTVLMDQVKTYNAAVQVLQQGNDRVQVQLDYIQRDIENINKKLENEKK